MLMIWITCHETYQAIRIELDYVWALAKAV